ncbi:MAG TPA: class I SAM-dependent methyltransferase [bacterium]|nr:class I SAM-dependent methyltransferase [bacterium]
MKDRIYRALTTVDLKYLRLLFPQEWGFYHFMRRVTARLQPGARIADVGCGTGRYRRYFSAQRYLGIDNHSGLGMTVANRVDIAGDSRALPLAAGALDAVLCMEVLEHVWEPRALLRETARVLRPGGQLFLTVPQGWGEHMEPVDFYRYTRFALDRLLREAGYTDIEIRPLGGYFVYLGQRLQQVPFVIMAGRTGAAKLPAMLLALALLPLCSFILPPLGILFDRLDREQKTTLNYAVLARKA